MSETLTKELNKQLNREFYSAYLYFAMSTYFTEISLSGFAKYMKRQAKEELKHAQKIHNYLIDRGGKIEYERIEAPDASWINTLDVFEYAYNHEKYMTESIYNIYEKAKEEKDYALEVFLDSFVEEQSEEEAKFSKMIDRIKIANACECGIHTLDLEL